MSRDYCVAVALCCSLMGFFGSLDESGVVRRVLFLLSFLFCAAAMLMDGGLA